MYFFTLLSLTESIPNYDFAAVTYFLYCICMQPLIKIKKKLVFL